MYYFLRCRLTTSDMHINSLLELDYSGVITHLCQKTFHQIKYILSMSITQDDGDNEHFLSPLRIASILHIAATFTNLIPIWKRGITKREEDWVNPIFQFLQSKKKFWPTTLYSLHFLAWEAFFNFQIKKIHRLNLLSQIIMYFTCIRKTWVYGK